MVEHSYATLRSVLGYVLAATLLSGCERCSFHSRTIGGDAGTDDLGAANDDAGWNVRDDGAVDVANGDAGRSDDAATVGDTGGGTDAEAATDGGDACPVVTYVGGGIIGGLQLTWSGPPNFYFCDRMTVAFPGGTRGAAIDLAWCGVPTTTTSPSGCEYGSAAVGSAGLFVELCAIQAIAPDATITCEIWE